MKGKYTTMNNRLWAVLFTGLLAGVLAWVLYDNREPQVAEEDQQKPAVAVAVEPKPTTTTPDKNRVVWKVPRDTFSVILEYKDHEGNVILRRSFSVTPDYSVELRGIGQ